MPKGKVSKIIDGDTFKIANGPYVRLAGVDTPEKDTKGFAKARNELDNLIDGEIVKYEEVGKSYGRIVAKVWIKGQSVNGAMKRKGYGE